MTEKQNKAVKFSSKQLNKEESLYYQTLVENKALVLENVLNQSNQQEFDIRRFGFDKDDKFKSRLLNHKLKEQLSSNKVILLSNTIKQSTPKFTQSDEAQLILQKYFAKLYKTQTKQKKIRMQVLDENQNTSSQAIKTQKRLINQSRRTLIKNEVFDELIAPELFVVAQKQKLNFSNRYASVIN